MGYQKLLDILEEEISIMDPEGDEEELLLHDMERAYEKIKEGKGAFLTSSEEEAISYALEDVGELYMLTGTSSGFDTEGLGPKDIKEHRERGLMARIEAERLGLKDWEEGRRVKLSWALRGEIDKFDSVEDAVFWLRRAEQEEE